VSPRTSTVWLLSAALLGTACGKVSTDPSAPGNSATAGNSATGGATSAAGGSDNTPAPPDPPVCTVASPGPAPLSPLDGFELGRSMADALREAPAVLDASSLPDLSLSGSPSEVTPELIRSVHTVAHDAALKLSQNDGLLRKVTDCDWLAQSSDECRDHFLERFLARVYRRPLVDEDRTEMIAVFQNGVQLGGGFESGVRAVVEVALQNPDFMYLVELGQDSPAMDGLQALTGYQTAARLAYFFGATPPDDELLAAAAEGPLSTSTIEEQARRLLGSAPNREALRHFYSKRFSMGTAAATADAEQGYTSDIAALAREESGRFLEDITFDGAGTFRALLTEPSTWVNGPLAQFYGYPNVTGDAFQKIQLDPTRRGGLFTQSAFLYSGARSTAANYVYRGLTISRTVLCSAPPPPPPNIHTSGLLEPMPDQSARSILEQATAAPVCQSCHRDINPLGFAFGHYDAYGRWLDTENGQPIDASGEVQRTDAAGPFNDALELMNRLPDSMDVQACFIEGWMSAAYRRDTLPADACALEEVQKRFGETNGNLAELMVALTKTDHFRYRDAAELEP